MPTVLKCFIVVKTLQEGRKVTPQLDPTQNPLLILLIELHVV